VNPPTSIGYRFHPINVTVVTTRGIFTGVVFCQQQQRLLDALNKGFYTPKNKTLTDFIPIYDVDASMNGDPKVLMDTAYIRKSDVLFVGEECDQSTPRSAPTHYPLRKKKVMKAAVNLPQIRLAGEMYSEIWEEFQDALIHVDLFIPMTNVDFYPQIANGSEHFSFVAVNKDHISYVGKLQP
jgi:hypothetical protein